METYRMQQLKYRSGWIRRLCGWVRRILWRSFSIASNLSDFGGSLRCGECYAIFRLPCHISFHWEYDYIFKVVRVGRVVIAQGSSISLVVELFRPAEYEVHAQYSKI